MVTGSPCRAPSIPGPVCWPSARVLFSACWRKNQAWYPCMTRWALIQIQRIRGAALLQFCRRLSDETYYADSQHKPEWIYTQHPPVTSPSSGQYTNTEIPTSDSETSPALSTQTCRPAHGMPQKRSSDSHLYPPYRHPVKIAASLLLRPEALDVNFNPRLEGDSSDGEERNKQVKRSRRRRKSKCKTSEHSWAHFALYSSATVVRKIIACWLIKKIILRLLWHIYNICDLDYIMIKIWHVILLLLAYQAHK